MTAPLQLQAGGALTGRSVYVQRGADDELYSSLQRGEFCFVLAPRQVGKSSLRSRVAARLREDGALTAEADIGGTGTSAVPPGPEEIQQQDIWLQTVLSEIVAELHDAAPDVVPEWSDEQWASYAPALPMVRFQRYVRDAVAEPCARNGIRAVIFIDEIDVLLGYRWRNEVFASVRQLFNERVKHPALESVSFCLVGLAAPSELMTDDQRTPFNIGVPVQLHDFTREQMSAFSAPLAAAGEPDPGALLDEVHAWTNGHPYMTQRLLVRLKEQLKGAKREDLAAAARRVEESVEQVFLRSGRTEDSVLHYAETYLTAPKEGVSVAEMLGTYREIALGGSMPVHGTGLTPVQLHLRLSGVAAEVETLAGEKTVAGDKTVAGRWLTPRNRIFARVFGLEWLEEKKPLIGNLETIAWERDQDGKRGQPRLAPEELRELVAEIAQAPRSVREGAAASPSLRPPPAYSPSVVRLVTSELDDARAAAEKAKGEAEEKRALAEQQRAKTERLLRIAVALGVLLLFMTALAVSATLSAMNATQDAKSAEAEALERAEAERRRQLAEAAGAATDGREVDALVWALGAVRYRGHESEPVPSYAMDALGRALTAARKSFSVEGDVFSRRLLVSSGSERHLWDADKQRVGAVMPAAPGIFNLIPTRFDERQVCGYTLEGRVGCWGLQTGVMTSQRLVDTRGDVFQRAAHFGDGQLLYWVGRTGDNTYSVTVEDLAGGRLVGDENTGFDQIDIEPSPDGKRLAVAGRNKAVAFVLAGDRNDKGLRPLLRRWQYAVRMVDIERRSVSEAQFNFMVQGTEPGESRAVAVFSPDGKSMIGALGREGRIWDLPGLDRERPASFQASAQGLRVFPRLDGFWALLANGTVEHHTLQGTRLEVYEGHRSAVIDAALSPDRSRLATASLDGTTRVYSILGRPLFELRGRESPTGVSYLPDGALVTWSRSGMRRWWNGPDWLPFHRLTAADAVFSPDGTLVASAGDDQSAFLWDVRSRATIAELSHGAAVRSALFSPDGKTLLTIDFGGRGHLWDGRTGARLAALERTEGPPGERAHRDAIWQATFSKDGARIATASWDGTACVWTSAGKQEWCTPGGSGRVVAVDFSPDGARLVTAGEDPSVVLWSVPDRKLLAALQGHTRSVATARFSPDGRWIATTSLDETAALWDVESCAGSRECRPKKQLQRHRGEVYAAAFSPAGDLLVTLGDDGRACLWSVAGAEQAVSQDDLVFGELLHEQGRAHPGWARSVVFSPNGDRFATTGDDGTRLWQIDRSGKKPTFRPLTILPGEPSRPYRARFSPDGRRVVIAHDDGTVRIDPATEESLIDLACELLTGMFDLRAPGAPPEDDDKPTGARDEPSERATEKDWYRAKAICQRAAEGRRP